MKANCSEITEHKKKKAMSSLMELLSNSQKKLFIDL